MPYSYQSFTSGQVFTGAQAQQIEDNIRDHKHGLAGVGVVGLGYNVSSKGGAFSVAAADHGTLFLAAGDFDISMAAAGTLGATFGCGIKNIGSGRVAVKPNGSQLIDASSYFVLTPGEMVNIYSDAIGLGTFGSSFGPKLLWDSGLIASLVNVDVTRLYPNDFALYDLRLQMMRQAVSGTWTLTVSQDSGSSFISAGYKDEITADTAFMRLSSANIGSLDMQYASVKFPNYRTSETIVGTLTGSEYGSTATPNAPVSLGSRSTRWPITSQLNAIRVTAPGTITDGRVQLWGYPRR